MPAGCGLQRWPEGRWPELWPRLVSLPEDRWQAQGEEQTLYVAKSHGECSGELRPGGELLVRKHPFEPT